MLNRDEPCDCMLVTELAEGNVDSDANTVFGVMDMSLLNGAAAPDAGGALEEFLSSWNTDVTSWDLDFPADMSPAVVQPKMESGVGGEGVEQASYGSVMMAGKEQYQVPVHWPPPPPHLSAEQVRPPHLSTQQVRPAQQVRPPHLSSERVRSNEHVRPPVSWPVPPAQQLRLARVGSGQMQTMAACQQFNGMQQGPRSMTPPAVDVHGIMTARQTISPFGTMQPPCQQRDGPGPPHQYVQHRPAMMSHHAAQVSRMSPAVVSHHAQVSPAMMSHHAAQVSHMSPAMQVSHHMSPAVMSHHAQVSPVMMTHHATQVTHMSPAMQVSHHMSPAVVSHHAQVSPVMMSHHVAQVSHMSLDEPVMMSSAPMSNQLHNLQVMVNNQTSRLHQSHVNSDGLMHAKMHRTGQRMLPGARHGSVAHDTRLYPPPPPAGMMQQSARAASAGFCEQLPSQHGGMLQGHPGANHSSMIAELRPPAAQVSVRSHAHHQATGRSPGQQMALRHQGRHAAMHPTAAMLNNNSSAAVLQWHTRCSVGSVMAQPAGGGGPGMAVSLAPGRQSQPAGGMAVSPAAGCQLPSAADVSHQLCPDARTQSNASLTVDFDSLSFLSETLMSSAAEDGYCAAPRQHVLQPSSTAGSEQLVVYVTTLVIVVWMILNLASVHCPR